MPKSALGKLGALLAALLIAGSVVTLFYRTIVLHDFAVIETEAEEETLGE